jgi:hypothetical protein
MNQKNRLINLISNFFSGLAIIGLLISLVWEKNNNRLHQLLGLRLRFCLRGKYSDVFTPIFQRNFVDLFWPVFAAATECKRAKMERISNHVSLKESKMIARLKVSFPSYILKFTEVQTQQVWY